MFIHDGIMQLKLDMFPKSSPYTKIIKYSRVNIATIGLIIIFEVLFFPLFQYHKKWYSEQQLQLED